MKRRIPVRVLGILILTVCGPLSAQIQVTHTPQSADDLALQVVTADTSKFTGLRVSPVSVGGCLLGKGGGFQIGDGTCAAFGSLDAAAFNVVSDLRAKHDIELIHQENAGGYLEYLRGIQTIAYRHLNENEATHPYKHIGVAAQSLPGELVAETTSTFGDPNSEPMLTVRLADWVGLLTVSLKEADRRITELEAQLACLRSRTGWSGPGLGRCP